MGISGTWKPPGQGVGSGPSGHHLGPAVPRLLVGLMGFWGPP